MARKRKGDPVNGWVILDKPVGMTSTAALARVKRCLNAQKAGHGGTLDPLASGILPVALGEATKVVAFAMDRTKAYRFTVRWGAETATDDAEGETLATSEARPDEAAILDAMDAFRGTISQVPPRYSAVKVDGERAYDIARDGEEPELNAREVEVEALELVSRPVEAHAEFALECGKGTYVRAIARDMGRALGCYGHVVSLRRTRVGPWHECDTITLDKLQCFSHSAAAEEAKAFIRPVETALDDIPALAVSRADAMRMRQGQPVLLRGRDAPLVHGQVFVECCGEPVALGEVRQGAVHPKRVFNLTN